MGGGRKGGGGAGKAELMAFTSKSYKKLFFCKNVFETYMPYLLKGAELMYLIDMYAQGSSSKRWKWPQLINFTADFHSVSGAHYLLRCTDSLFGNFTTISVDASINDGVEIRLPPFTSGQSQKYVL